MKLQQKEHELELKRTKDQLADKLNEKELEQRLQMEKSRDIELSQETIRLQFEDRIKLMMSSVDDAKQANSKLQAQNLNLEQKFKACQLEMEDAKLQLSQKQGLIDAQNKRVQMYSDRLKEEYEKELQNMLD